MRAWLCSDARLAGSHLCSSYNPVIPRYLVSLPIRPKVVHNSGDMGTFRFGRGGSFASEYRGSANGLAGGTAGRDEKWRRVVAGWRDDCGEVNYRRRSSRIRAKFASNDPSLIFRSLTEVVANTKIRQTRTENLQVNLTG
jgi:hypothetical protein